MLGMRETRKKRLRVQMTRKRGGQLPLLQEIATIRETAKNYAAFSKEKANIVSKNLSQLKRSQHDYKMSILGGIHDLAFPPKVYSSYLAYYMDTFPIRFRVTKEIVLEQLPTYHLEDLMERHKEFANRASDLVQHITKNAKTFHMSNPSLDNKKGQMEETKKHLQQLQLAREQLDAEFASVNEQTKRQGEAEAFDFIKGLSFQEKSNGSVKNTIFPYEFTIKQPKTTSKILTVELQPAIAYLGLTDYNLYVLKEWIRVSLDLIHEMRQIDPETASGALILNETKKPKNITEHQWIGYFITSNIVATYKITALVAYAYYQKLSEVVKKRTSTDSLKQRTNTIDTIRDEMQVRKAELQFYEILNEWLLMSMKNMTDRPKHDRYRSYANMIHDYLPLLHEHIRLRTSEYAEQKRKRRVPVGLPSTVQRPSTAASSKGISNFRRKMIERQFVLTPEQKELLKRKNI